MTRRWPLSLCIKFLAINPSSDIGLWLVSTCHVTWILASDWSILSLYLYIEIPSMDPSSGHQKLGSDALTSLWIWSSSSYNVTYTLRTFIHRGIELVSPYGSRATREAVEQLWLVNTSHVTSILASHWSDCKLSLYMDAQSKIVSLLRNPASSNV